MFRPTFRALGIIATLLGLSVAATGCGRPSRLPTEPSSQAAVRDTAQDSATVLALDRKYWEAEKTKDWSWVSAFVAPAYYGVGSDFEIDRAGLERDFPKVNLLDYELQPPRIRFVRRDLAVVSYVGRMKEFFDGQDISGRYWYSTTWTLVNNEWKLLVEQEVRLDSPPPPSK
jgi:Domain of unknown function (DUF4440)